MLRGNICTTYTSCTLYRLYTLPPKKIVSVGDFSPRRARETGCLYPSAGHKPASNQKIPIKNIGLQSGKALPHGYRLKIASDVIAKVNSLTLAH